MNRDGSKGKISIIKVNVKNKQNKYDDELSDEINFSDSKSSKKETGPIDECVCRICLCTEEEGTPSEDG